jgi:hypothetical protein
MTQTKLKVNRRISKNQESQESWTIWAVDKREGYPEKPCTYGRCQMDVERILHNWERECLDIAGLDWDYFYYGPGQLFAHDPNVWVCGSRILFTQHCGYDV